MRRIAAIDIGTVTCRLLIADVDTPAASNGFASASLAAASAASLDSASAAAVSAATDAQPNPAAMAGIHELYRTTKIVNLGAGVDATGRLAPDAIDCVAAAVAEYKAIIDRYSSEEPVEVRCLATSACRDAENAQEFAERLAQIGVELMIIPGQREAQLSFLGASAGFAGERLIVSDVGGGSTELIAGVAGQGVVHAHSFDIGCRRATERLLVSDPPTPAEIDALRAWIRPEFTRFFEELASLGFEPQRYIAVAGTATSVVSIDLNMETYDSALVHGHTVDAATLARITERLAALPLEQRAQVVGLHPRRAPIIVAGFVILQEVLAASGLPSYTASETDILEGIILGGGA